VGKRRAKPTTRAQSGSILCPPASRAGSLRGACPPQRTLGTWVRGAHVDGRRAGLRDAAPRSRWVAITMGIHVQHGLPEYGATVDTYLARWRIAARLPSTWAPLTQVPQSSLWRARNRAASTALDAGGHQYGSRLRPGRRLCASVLPPTNALICSSRSPTAWRACWPAIHGGPWRLCSLARRTQAIHLENFSCQRMSRRSQDERFRGRLVFLPDYDLELGSTPRSGSRRLVEYASPPTRGKWNEWHESHLNGRTSSQRAGRLVGRSVPTRTGLALGIRLREDLADDARDAAEAHQWWRFWSRPSPMFFSRDADGVPREWLARVRALHPDVGATIQRRTAWSLTTPCASTGLHPGTEQVPASRSRAPSSRPFYRRWSEATVHLARDSAGSEGPGHRHSQ